MYSLSRLEEKAKEVADGHYTIMKFTTGYKVMIGTPEGREDIRNIKSSKTLEEAVEEVLCQG